MLDGDYRKIGIRTEALPQMKLRAATQFLTWNLARVKQFVAPAISVASDYFAKNGPLFAAAIAFYGFMSIFPLMIGSIALMHLFFGHTEIEETIAKSIVDHIPVLRQETGPSFVETFITETASKPAVTSGITGLVMFISALGVFGAVRQSINVMWGAERRPGFLTTRLIEGSMLVMGSFLLFTSLVVSTLISFLGEIGHVFFEETGNFNHWFIDVGGFAITLVISTALFAGHYRWLPQTKVTFAEVLPVSIVTGLAFEIVKLVFIFYLHHGAERFLTFYGSVANLMMLFLFFFTQANILLLGALLCSKWVAFTRKRRSRLAAVVAA